MHRPFAFILTLNFIFNLTFLPTLAPLRRGNQVAFLLLGRLCFVCCIDDNLASVKKQSTLYCFYT